MNTELTNQIFSQSLYISSTNITSEECKAKKTSKKLPFFKNIQENLPRIEKYDPMINREVALKYSFNKLLMDIEKYMKDTDLNKSKAPFLPHTFQVWRQETWEKLCKNLKNLPFETQQKWKKKFVYAVDGDYLIKLFRLMKEPYFNLIFFENYHMPSAMKDSNFKKDDYLCKFYLKKL